MKLSTLKKRVSTVLVITLFAMFFSYIVEKQHPAGAATIVDSVTLSVDSKFVSENDGKVAAYANAYFKDELFLMEDHGNNEVSFKSKASGRYLSYAPENGNSEFKLHAVTASTLTKYEKFKKIPLDDGYFRLETTHDRGPDNRYLEVSSFNIIAKNKEVNDRQKFKIVTRSLRTTVNVLEITQTGVSDLASLVGGTPLISVKTLSMKQFVASRESLKDKYDAVYIGRGTYNITLPSKAASKDAHVTKHIQNDITQLKANEIIHNFVDTGLPVILYSDSGSGSGIEYQADLKNWQGKITQYGLLKKNFAKYNTRAYKRDNVVFVNEYDLSTVQTFTAKINLLEAGNLRPQLTVTSQPIDYTKDQNHVYKPGDTISFGYTVANVGDLRQKTIEANLYIGMDSALPFGAEQLVATQKVATSTGSITYTLPPGYSGLQYWRLELSDFNSPLIDAKTGVFRFKDQKISINVLQVMPKDNTSSSLNNSKNMKASYLSPTTDPYKDAYTIKVDTMSITRFNESGYRTLNGKYDMLIFGFGDYYNNYAPIDDAASEAVLDFIATGQSVMLTHDTIFLNDNPNNKNWLDKFGEISGQINPQTNMGFGNPLSSTKTEKVNDGLLTQYPFLLDKATEKLVAATHNQYFTLDLEDPTVIPWYNMVDNTYRTPGDSWNHYYTYSKGNVTYSGSGHTNSDFPDWEQKLFVNTMFRAYMGSNHAPQLTVNSPIEYNSATDNFIPSYSDLLINYSAVDFDLNDRDLTTSVNLIMNGKSTPVIEKQHVLSGETINKSIPNPLPEGGNATIEIKAWDEHGAEVVKQIKVKVVKITANLELSRSVSTNVEDNRLKINDTAFFTYTVTPKAVDKNDALAADRMIIKKVKFSEKFPPQLDIGTLPDGFTKTGTLTDGYTVTGTLPDIAYTLSGNAFTAKPVSFELPVIPRKDGFYSLMEGTLNYLDVGGQSTKTMQFPSYVLQAITMIERIQLSSMTILEGDKKPFIPTITPDTATIKQLTWESDRPDIATVNSSGIVTGMKPGTAVIRATATDGSKQSATATVTVIRAGLNIIGSDRVAVHETMPLTSSLYTADYEMIESYSWKISQGSSFISLQSSNSNATIVNGLNAGTATVQLTVTTNENRAYTATKTITVFKQLTGLELNDATLALGESEQLTPIFTPADALNKTVSWSSSDDSVVTVDKNGVITGVGVGEATVTASSADGSGLTADAIVTVYVPQPTISAADNVALGEKLTVQLTSFLESKNDPVDSASWNILQGSDRVVPGSKAQNFAEYETLKAGIVEVQLQLHTVNGRTYTSNSVQVQVEPITLMMQMTKSMDPGTTAELWNELSSNPKNGKNAIKDLLKWASSDSGTVSVNRDTGQITALKPGSATITVAYEHDPAVRASMTIIVNRPPVEPPSLGNGESRY
ncbi:DUF5057 domain-containing protein [Paenibacillus nanensis]|uniref:DUF5057 domain-containing protein n=1 Tax=Paenibacillus nanensis TaxID=393251 RepID=A0A3A1V9D9_9BACL|nr:DUF5057 domain-containing protein [Paenibacillus nanensis]RIX54040.1 DUF5057 domain-containing protein [Paenibacillus nanensis]